MTPDTLMRFRPYLTIYTQSPAPGAEGAPILIQRALALAGQSGADIAVAPPSPFPTQPQTAEQAAAASAAPPQAKAEAGPERLIAVEATAHGRDGGVYVRYAVLRLAATSPQGYDIRDWERGSLPAENAKLTD
jgi:hypothetical protein